MDELAQALRDAIRAGDVKAVEKVLFSLMGTGICCQRLALLQATDREGLRPEDLAQSLSVDSVVHQDIYRLLSCERGRMEFFE